MPKTRYSDYRDELAFQRDVWGKKPAIRKLYEDWYGRIVGALSTLEPVVELGAGCGNFKQYYPHAIATDAIQAGDWIDRVVDAQHLPFAENEVGNFVMIDCLHHLVRPLRFLRSAARALKPGGRLVLLEPAVTPWARLVWRLFHHEPVDMHQDLFAEDNQPAPANDGLEFANMGIATLLFVRHWPRTSRELPELTLVRREYSDAVVYPATGGFSYRRFLPGWFVPALHRIEDVLNRPFASWLTGMRLLIVAEKRRASAS